MKPFQLLKVLVLFWGFILIPTLIDESLQNKPQKFDTVKANTLDTIDPADTNLLAVAPGKFAAEPGETNIGIPIVLFSNGDPVNILAFSLSINQDWLTCQEVRINVPGSQLIDCDENDESVDVVISANSPLDGTVAYLFADVVATPPESLPFATLIDISQGPDCSTGSGVPVDCIGNAGEIIINHPPTVENLTLGPINPSEGNELSPSFDLNDPDNANSVQATIRWTLNGQTQATLINQLSVPLDFTQQNDEWCVQITPEEVIENRKISGGTAEQCVKIGVPNPNMPPEPTTPVTLRPEEPGDTSTLVANFIFDDPDNGNLIADTRWYRNGQLQPGFNERIPFTSGEEVELYLPDDETHIGETWCVVITVTNNHNAPQKFESNCVIVHPPDNKLPQVQEASIFPSTPEPESFLLLTYEFIDSNGDTEQATQIRWYRDGILQSAFNDKTFIDSGIIQKGERWYATIRPHDGSGYGMVTQTPTVAVTSAIENTDPEASVAQINLQAPPTYMALSNNSGGELQLSYEYLDANGDLETGTIIQWYKNLEYQPDLNGYTRIPADKTKPGDIWYATIYPHDAETYGARVAVQPVQLPDNTLSLLTANESPEVQEVYISPALPGPDSNLTLHYEYHDADGDPEGDTKIRWQKNNSPEPFDDVTLIPKSVVNVGEEWCAYITPHDGKTYGPESDPESDRHCVTIGQVQTNSPPQIENARILPEERAGLNSNLRLEYDFFDPDNQDEGSTEIRWYKKGKNDSYFYYQESFDDLTVIPASETAPGDQWQVKIRPHDGIEFGPRFGPKENDLEPVRINHPPSEFQTVSITPANPHDQQTLRLQFNLDEFDDADEDDIPDKWIDWYRNGDLIEDEHGALLSSTNTSVGDIITATIFAYDGYDFSDPIASSPVKITAAPINYLELFLPYISKPGVDPKDPYEPNNDQGSSTPIDPGTTYNALPNDVNDWYSFEVRELTLSELKITANNYEAHGQLVLYKQENFPLTIVNDREWREGGKFENCHLDGESLLFRCLIANDGRNQPKMLIEDPQKTLIESLPGTYLIRVYTSKDFNEDEQYALHVHKK